MKIAIVSDAWRPQVNGVVTTLVDLRHQLLALGHDVYLIEPSQFKRVPCPFYPEIERALMLGAEYLGAQSGLGYVIVYAQQFAYLDRMFLVALLFIIYTSISYWAVSRVTAKMLEWAPPSQRR